MALRNGVGGPAGRRPLLAVAAALVGMSLCGCSSGAAARSDATTTADRTAQYYYYRYTVTPCILTLRFRVVDPPTLEEFLEQTATTAWNPYSDTQRAASDYEYQRVRTICPPVPSHDVGPIHFDWKLHRGFVTDS